jgi:3',5'-cyclic AMP phosphodiesterase CpdA
MTAFFRLVHLSDPHIGPLPRPRWRELLGKRATGYINWQRGRHRAHDMDALAALVSDLRAQKPDHVALTGDICNIGLPAEYPLAAQWMRTLGAPHEVSLAPGNHDAYLRASVRHMVREWRPWISGDRENEGSEGERLEGERLEGERLEGEGLGEENFPFLRRRDGVAIIGLCSGVPMLPFVAAGKLGASQLERFEAMLDATRGDMRVVLLHHPPVDGGGAIRNLQDHRDFARVLARMGAELVLHGHAHSITRKSMAGPEGPIPVLGIGSASSIGRNPRRRAAYYLIDIDAKARRLQHIAIRQLGADGQFHSVAAQQPG